MDESQAQLVTALFTSVNKDIKSKEEAIAEAYKWSNEYIQMRAKREVDAKKLEVSEEASQTIGYWLEQAEKWRSAYLKEKHQYDSEIGPKIKNVRLVEKPRKMLEAFRQQSEKKMQAAYTRAVFDETDMTVYDKLCQLLKGPPDLFVKSKLIDWVDENMSMAGLKPNKLQLAVGLSIALNGPQTLKDAGKKNQMIVIPPAKGKTRIAMAAVLGMTQIKSLKVTEIIIVYQTSLLRQQDEAQWTRLDPFVKATSCKITRVVSYKEALEKSTNNTVIIVDEADKTFIDEAQDLPK